MKKQIFFFVKNLVKNISIVSVFFIALTLISSSSVSVTINKMSKIGTQNLAEIEEETSIIVEQSNGLAPLVTVENPDIPAVSLPFGAIMWGYIVNSSVFDEGTCYFDINDPGTIEYLQDTESDDFLSGGTGCTDGYWYACENSTGALWKIDPDNGDMTYIGGGGVGLNGLSHDVTTNILYGALGSALYMIDIENGEQEFIGSCGVNCMIGIAFDYDGVLYGWSISSDCLYTINIETGEATEVGPLGINLNYAQGGHFCMEDDILYLAAYTIKPDTCFLYECDEDKGACTLISQFDNNYTVSFLAIPYDYSNQPPTAPYVTGPTYGNIGVGYEWTFLSTDPEDDNITYYVDWGDVCGGAEWHGPYQSGEEVTLAHTYYYQNSFIINTLAVDENGAESDWTYYEVTMPKNKMLYNPLLLRLLERFPNTFYILRQLLRL